MRISAVTGTLLALAVCWWLVPGIGLTSPAQHLVLGLTLAVFMAAFDIGFGALVLRFSWRRILRDFNPASGNYLSLGLVALAGIPVLVFWLRP
ncbi:MAG: hypothetical protein H6933_20625 [Burkholderiaceae bacterium]|nr:hypothetical protein [Burkholderiaceae bacterium]